MHLTRGLVTREAREKINVVGGVQCEGRLHFQTVIYYSAMYIVQTGFLDKPFSLIFRLLQRVSNINYNMGV